MPAEWVKNSPTRQETQEMGNLIPGSGRSLEEGNGNPLQYSCVDNPWTEEPGRLPSTGSQRVAHS